jgi:hypothetical protein
VTAIQRRALPVAGSAVLPAGFWHPHASEQARAIAEDGMILRVQVSSGVHGTAVTGQDDRDEMGLCLEPPQFVAGMARVPSGIGGQGPSVRFEQYERHTAWDRLGGLANRSGAGDLGVVIYSARKWARLALAGNPTVLLVLFVPDQDVVVRSQVGAELTDNAHRFVSRLAAHRFLGYLHSQKGAMTPRHRRTHQPARAGRRARLRHQVRDARAAARVAGHRAADHRADHPAGT